MKLRLAAIAFVFASMASITVMNSESAGFGGLEARGCNCTTSR